MGICWWCTWGWPKPIRDIYDAAVKKLRGYDHELGFGPGHIVWGDENWHSAQWCLEHFEEHAGKLTEEEKVIVRESLTLLLAVDDEYKSVPEGYDDENPENYPPPKHWQCERR